MGGARLRFGNLGAGFVRLFSEPMLMAYVAMRSTESDLPPMRARHERAVGRHRKELSDDLRLDAGIGESLAKLAAAPHGRASHAAVHRRPKRSKIRGGLGAKAVRTIGTVWHRDEQQNLR